MKHVLRKDVEKSNTLEWWLEEADGKITLRCKSDDGWSVLSILPSGAFCRHNCVPSDIGLQVDGAGGIIQHPDPCD